MSNFSSGARSSLSTSGRSSINASFLMPYRLPLSAVGAELAGGLYPITGACSVLDVGATIGSVIGTGFGVDSGSGFGSVVGVDAGVSSNPKLLPIFDTPARTLASSWSSLIGCVVCD